MLPPSKELSRTLTKIGESALTQSGAPGLGLSVFTLDEVLFERGFGLRDREAELPVTPNTIFGIASVTKSFTALTALKLAERGVIGLGDPVDRYYDFGAFWGGAPAATVEQLLSHTGGIPPTPTMTWLRLASQQKDPVTAGASLTEAKLTLVNGAMGMPPARSGALTLEKMEAAAEATEDNQARKELARLAARVATFAGLARWIGENAAPLAPPGELYSYSNDSFCLVGGILEAAAGECYASLVRREILEPLGMSRTLFDAAAVVADDDHSTLYTRSANDQAVRRSPEWQATGGMLAGGMLKSTLRDLRAYVRGFLADPRSADALATPRADSGPVEEYGLGLSVLADYRGLRIVKHGGSLKGVSSVIGFAPQLGIGVVVLCNLNGVNTEQVLLDALSACAGLPLGVPAYQPTPSRAGANVLDLLGDYLSGEPYGRLRLYETATGDLRAKVGWPSVDLPAAPTGIDEVTLTYPNGNITPLRFLRRNDAKVWGAQAGRILHRL